MAAQFYVRKRGRVTGPFELAEVLKLKDQGRLTRVHELSRDQVEWTPAFEVDEVFRAFVELPDEGNKYMVKEPAAAKSNSASGEMEWYYVFDGDRLGPVSTEKLAALVNDSEIKADTLVWSTELADWSPASSVSHLSKLLKKEFRSKQSPKIDTKSKSTSGTCKGCGANLNSSATRCASCGKKVGGKGKRWLLVSIALLVLLMILLGIAAVVIMQQMPDIPPQQ